MKFNDFGKIYNFDKSTQCILLATTSFYIIGRSLRVTNLACLLEIVQPIYERDSREIKGRFQKISVTLIFNSHNMFFRQILREFARSRTRVRQISNDFARSHVAFFRGCFVCVWHCHVCQTSSQKDHCMSFYLNAIAD